MRILNNSRPVLSVRWVSLWGSSAGGFLGYQGSVRITNHLNGTQLNNYRRQLFTSRSLCIVMLDACYARIHHMGTREALGVLVRQRRYGTGNSLSLVDLMMT